MQLSVGAHVRSFEVLGPLGAGGMGAVYRARDPRLGRDVAIKILQDRLSDSREYLLRFEREARAASALNHPNIITIFEIGEFDGAPFIAMELIEGVSLRDLLKKGAVPIRKLLDLAAQIADGLGAAHDRGIIHRDLKPENVMITNDGRVKILDFGLARIDRAATSAESTGDLTSVRTPEGRVLGTASYVSPEQASGGRDVDYRSDQFSFGSMLYEMVTGRRAFQRNTTVETLSAIVRDEPDAIQRLKPATPAPLCWIVERCLEKDPSDRYASTRDLAHELRTLRDRLPETGAGTRRLPMRWSVRTRAIGLATVVILTIIGVVGSSHRFGGAHPQQLPNQKYLAVLPFTDLSGRADGALFSQGFAEAVSARLAKYSGIQVIPPASSVALVAKNADAKRIAQEVGATLLLNASVQRAANTLRVSYHVLDVNKGTEASGDIVDGTVENMWTVQDEVADDVARDLGIANDRQAKTEHKGLKTLEEQDLYVKALGNLEHYEDETMLDAAVLTLRQLTETASDSPLVYAALARAYLSKYNITHDMSLRDKAMFACDRATSLDGNSPDVVLTLADLQRVTGHYDAAVAAYKQALALQPNLPEAAIGLGKAYQANRDYVASELAFRRGINLRPTWWSGHMMLGNLYLVRGRYDDAGIQFREVIRLNPQSPWGYTNLGNVYVSKGRLQDAVSVYRKAISVRPNADAYSNLGYCYYYLGKYEDSAGAYRMATDLQPRVAMYWANLGDACTWTAQCRDLARDAYEKAIALLRTDLIVNPNRSSTHATLAVCLAKIHSYDEASLHVRRALELEPENPTRMYQAARVANLSGHSADAIQWLRRAFTSGYEQFEVQRDPEFANLRSTDQFREVVNKVRAPT